VRINKIILSSFATFFQVLPQTMIFSLLCTPVQVALTVQPTPITELLTLDAAPSFGISVELPALLVLSQELEFVFVIMARKASFILQKRKNGRGRGK
jgi:Sec-independent protein secretion pathway component TatC